MTINRPVDSFFNIKTNTISKSTQSCTRLSSVTMKPNSNLQVTALSCALLTALAVALPAEDTGHQDDAGNKKEPGPVSPTKEPFIVVANLTDSINATEGKPIEIKAKVVPTPLPKPGESRAPSIAVMSPESPSQPLDLLAKVPPKQPVEIHANVPFKVPVKVVTEMAPGVPEVAVVVHRGREYMPWRRASSTTRGMFNVNFRRK